jgi:hypothetical protein
MSAKVLAVKHGKEEARKQQLAAAEAVAVAAEKATKEAEEKAREVAKVEVALALEQVGECV